MVRDYQKIGQSIPDDLPKNWSEITKKLVSIRMICQKIGQGDYQKIGVDPDDLPKNWSEIAKKLVRDYQKIGVDPDDLPKNWCRSG